MWCHQLAPGRYNQPRRQQARSVDMANWCGRWRAVGVNPVGVVRNIGSGKNWPALVQHLTQPNPCRPAVVLSMASGAITTHFNARLQPMAVELREGGVDNPVVGLRN